MPAPDALTRFQSLLHDTLASHTLVKLTLGKPRPGAPEPTLRNVFVRPVTLKTGPQLSFVYRHDTRDITKNLPAAEAGNVIRSLLAESFLDAHLFTPLQTAQLEQNADAARPARLRVKTADSAPPVATTSHDRSKSRLVAPDAAWLRALGVTNDRGQPREGMAHKFRQIEKFAELLQSLLAESGFDSLPGSAGLPPGTLASALPTPPLRLADMGAGKGYLTFALADLLGDRAEIVGLERRADLVATCNRVAADCGLAPRLRFMEGDIPSPRPPEANVRNTNIASEPPASSSLGSLDALIALHACDTATDDALAAGHAAGARLLVVSPCCQKELRPRLVAPPVLAESLRHGIFLERQAEFVTDALRAQLLECAGYRTKVFEFVSTEHTAKNLMLAAVRPAAAAARGAAFEPDPAALARVRAFAAFYGIREQRLARHLGLDLAPAS
jgi:SAM-dependent methyltransferase